MARRYNAKYETATTEEIIANIFYCGCRFTWKKATQKEERDLQDMYMELEHRGVVKDWEAAYNMVCK